jgi:hypothetical protein
MSEASSKIVTSIIRTEFSKRDAFIILERENVEFLFAENRLQEQGDTVGTNAQKHVKLLPSEMVIKGEVGKIGEVYLVTGHVVDVANGEIKYSEIQRCYNESDLELAARVFSYELIGKILKGRAEKPEKEKIPGKTSVIKLPDPGQKEKIIITDKNEKKGTETIKQEIRKEDGKNDKPYDVLNIPNL